MKYKNNRKYLEKSIERIKKLFPNVMNTTVNKWLDEYLDEYLDEFIYDLLATKQEDKWVGKFAPNGGHDPDNPFPLKQEDNKECKCVNCEGGLNKKRCLNNIPTPSLLDDICEIKRFILVTDGSDVVLYPEMKDMAIKLNEVIKTINLIIKHLKQK